MACIENFVEVRADGKLIPSDMSLDELLAQGWDNSPVIGLRWNQNGRQVEIDAPGGVIGIVVPGANYVAAMYERDDTHPCGHLFILSADGSRRGVIDDPIVVAGYEEFGWFGWFEPAMAPQSDVFGAMFQTNRQGEIRCDIDAAAVKLVRAVKVS